MSINDRGVDQNKATCSDYNQGQSMSVLSLLTSLASEAVLSKTEQSSIATSIATLETRLAQHFGLNVIGPNFRFGSSTRGTILPRTIDAESDIDYMIVFKEGALLRMPQTYLSRLREFAEKYYSRSIVRQSHPSIVLELNHIRFDLVPAIPYWLGGVQIPDSTGDWMTTDPTGFNLKLEKTNKSHQSLIKPTIRLMKYWNIASKRPFESFETEKWICSLNLYHLANLRGYLFEVIGHLSTSYFQAQWINNEITRAKTIVAKVKQCESQGLNKIAEEEVRKLFRC